MAKEAAHLDGPELCALAYRKQHDALRQYLEAHPKAVVDQRHPGGWTPLMVAAARGDLPAVELLLSAGAAVDAEDLYTGQVPDVRARDFPLVIHPYSNAARFTALAYAVLAGSAEVAQCLLEAGAEPTHQDAKGRTPRDMIEHAPSTSIPALTALFDTGLAGILETRRRKERERRRQFPLEKRIHEVIVGQEGPINALASAIRRKENGWQDSDHPLVFLFLGSSGIGKTELAKQIAAYIHGDDKEAFIRVDMSEYGSRHEAAKFIGSPPGYVGHDEGGQLTKKLAKKPNAVVLLDEVEKAHPDVLTVMLQVFDEGRLTDGKGKTIDCKDAVFVMTSNLAQQEIADEALRLRAAGVPEDQIPEEFKVKVVQPILRQALKRDEFLGRINEVLYFLPFTPEQLRELAERQLQKWAKRAEERHHIRLTWRPEVVELLTRGYNVRYGARSIQYEVDRKVIGKIASYHEEEKLGRGCHVEVSADLQTEEVSLRVTEGAAGDAPGTTGILPASARAALRRIF
eukprot:EG_transcript_9858